MNREKIYLALYAKVEKLDGIKTLNRKLKHWSEVDEFPAAFMAQGNETAIKSGRGVPTKWEFDPMIYLYVRVEDGQIPAPILNRYLDLLTDSLKSKTPDNKQTLGGLVEDCWIDGQIITDEGTLGETAVAIIPVKLIVLD